MTEAEAAARLEFTNTTLALTTLASSQEFAAASTRDQAEAAQLLILGYASSAEEAATMAASISDKGGLSESLLAATSQTEQLNLELAKLEGDKESKVSVSVDGIESLREAVGLTQQMAGGGRKDGAATAALPEARAVGGDISAGSPLHGRGARRGTDFPQQERLRGHGRANPPIAERSQTSPSANGHE
ncbi:MAG: hypothetical protein IPL28_25200 [Chloroflexi bacterium]|nr:hypothetical protein [Chloroflexota bacterium]